MRSFRFMMFGFLQLSLLLSLAACSWKKQEEDLRIGDRVLVQVPFALNGQYSLKIVELFTLTNLTELKGLAAQFLMDPDSVSGALRGRSPRIRYIRNEEGVIIPKDDLSLQLLTMYAHLEKLRNLDTAAGAEGVATWPTTVAVNAKYRDANGNSENNAIFSGKYDALLMVPYTQQALPVMANGGVVGHEHFHALFYKLVIQPLKDLYPEVVASVPHRESRLEEKFGLESASDSGPERNPGHTVNEKDLRKQYHAIVLGGINEGLADVWGWIFTGDVDLVGRSLPSEKYNRKLDLYGENLKLSSTMDIRLAPQYNKYQLGTQVARSLQHFAYVAMEQRKLSLPETRLLMAKWLIATLPTLREKFAALKDDEYLAPSEILNLFSAQVQGESYAECSDLASRIPEDDQKKLATERCESFNVQDVQDKS